MIEEVRAYRCSSGKIFDLKDKGEAAKEERRHIVSEFSKQWNILPETAEGIIKDPGRFVEALTRAAGEYQAAHRFSGK